jgi:hypothetical protein
LGASVEGEQYEDTAQKYSEYELHDGNLSSAGVVAFYRIAAHSSKRCRQGMPAFFGFVDSDGGAG